MKNLWRWVLQNKSCNCILFVRSKLWDSSSTFGPTLLLVAHHLLQAFGYPDCRLARRNFSPPKRFQHDCKFIIPMLWQQLCWKLQQAFQCLRSLLVWFDIKTPCCCTLVNFNLWRLWSCCAFAAKVICDTTVVGTCFCWAGHDFHMRVNLLMRKVEQRCYVHFAMKRGYVHLGDSINRRWLGFRKAQMIRWWSRAKPKRAVANDVNHIVKCWLSFGWCGRRSCLMYLISNSE